VKNVGEGAIESIIEVRGQGGPFGSLFDFTERVDARRVNRRVVESLVKCGAFDRLHENRAALWESLDSALERGASVQRDREVGQDNLFGGGSGEEEGRPVHPRCGTLERERAPRQRARGAGLLCHRPIRWRSLPRSCAAAPM